MSTSLKIGGNAVFDARLFASFRKKSAFFGEKKLKLL